MHVEESRLGRAIKPVLIAALVVGAIAVPTWLWVLRGRKLPLTVVLDPPRFIVRSGQVTPLRPRITPYTDDLVLTWEGGVKGAGREATWTAPDRTGLHTVTLRVRRSGTIVKDSVTFRVFGESLSSYRLTRPAPRIAPPGDVPGCKPAAGEPAPRVVILGKPCAGGTVVARLEGLPAASKIWHRPAGGQALAGQLANLWLTGGDDLRLTTLAAPPGGGCAYKLETTISPGKCRAGPASGPVFADFSWQMAGPGRFRFSAKPSRTKGVAFETYRWDFGDGKKKRTSEPRVSHHYSPPLRSWWVVRLEVQGPAGRAATVRAVFDRSVGAGEAAKLRGAAGDMRDGKK